ncbi:hypothetical protein DYB31_011693 [Aphanomyces astaci]|nr:hypothetical protein DYB31_011693 [Aphanomyces astaci]
MRCTLTYLFIATRIAFVALLGMSSPRRTSVAKAGQSAAPVPEVVKPKPERFVLSSGHDAHDLLEAAETELKGCSNLEPTPLDSLSDDGDDADKDNDADDHLRQQVVVYTTNLHLKALPRHGNRTRRMIMSTPTKRVSKAKPKGPRTYDELEALMKSLTTPRSAVYRHAAHMTDVAALGVRIYNVNDHPREATDRIVVARRLSATPSTPHNKAKHNSGRQYVNQAQPRLMKNQKYIERENEFL